MPEAPSETDAPAEWFEPGLSFKCTQCGNCCTGPSGYVWFTDEEAEAMADYLGLSEREFRKRYTRRKFGKSTLDETKRNGRYDCVFLTWNEDGSAGCSIYRVRPRQCRTWPFWPENLASRRAWDEAATTCPGMRRTDGTFVPADEVRVIRDSH